MSTEPLKDEEVVIFQGGWVAIGKVESRYGEYEIVKLLNSNNNGDGVNVIIIAQNKLLLVQQYRPPVRNSVWELPGGAVDMDGKTIAENAAREVWEEVGISVKPEELKLTSIHHPMPSIVEATGYIYFVELPDTFDLNSVKIQEEEIDDYKWMDLTELMSAECLNTHMYDDIIKEIMMVKALGYLA